MVQRYLIASSELAHACVTLLEHEYAGINALTTDLDEHPQRALYLASGIHWNSKGNTKEQYIFVLKLQGSTKKKAEVTERRFKVCP